MPNTSRPNSNKAAAVSLICRQTLGALILVLTAGMARADIIQVKMEKLGFVPAEVTAHVGDTIEWVNADFVAHTGYCAQRCLGRSDPGQRKKERGSQG
jgi:plastocyanin